MRGTGLFALLLGSALVFGIGCKKDEAPASGSAPPAADPNSTGVAECDDYFKQMTDCYSSNPAAKAGMEATMTKMRETFRAQVQAPGGKEALKAQCLEHIKLLAQNPMCAKK